MAFNVEHALELGSAEAAALVYGLQGLVASRPETDGRRWLPITLEGLSRQFPWWTRHQLDGLLAKLVKAGVLLKQHPRGADRTSAYAFADEERFLCREWPDSCPFPEKRKWSEQPGKAISAKAEPISAKAEMGTNGGSLTEVSPLSPLPPSGPSSPGPPSSPPSPNPPISPLPTGGTPSAAPNGAAGPSGRKASGAKSEPHPEHNRLMTLYAAALGYTKPNGAQHIPAAAGSGAAAKRLLTGGFTPEEVVACYRWLKTQRFWVGKLVSLMEVEKQIGEWVNLGKPARDASRPARKTPSDTVDELRLRLGWTDEQ